MVISIEVDNLDEIERRVREERLAIENGPTTEPRGVRRFYVRVGSSRTGMVEAGSPNVESSSRVAIVHQSSQFEAWLDRQGWRRCEIAC